MTQLVVMAAYLCLLLGYSGQYNLGQDQKMGELDFYRNKVSGKIDQIRRVLYDSAPQAPEEAIQLTGRDPWVRRLAVTAVLCLGLALIFYVLYWSFLSSGVSELNSLAGVALPSMGKTENGERRTEERVRMPDGQNSRLPARSSQIPAPATLLRSVSAVVRPPFSVLPTPAITECVDLEYTAVFAKRHHLVPGP